MIGGRGDLDAVSLCLVAGVGRVRARDGCALVAAGADVEHAAAWMRPLDLVVDDGGLERHALVPGMFRRLGTAGGAAESEQYGEREEGGTSVGFHDGRWT